MSKKAVVRQGPGPGKKASPGLPTYLVYLGAAAVLLALGVAFIPGLMPSGQRKASGSVRSKQAARTLLHDHGETKIIGNKIHHPSFGLFPKGCK